MLEANKQLVRRLLDEVMARRDLAVLDEVAEGEFAESARRWISPFQGSFPDFRMEVLGLVAEGDQVVAHLKCSGTHTGEWLGIPPTGKRFEDVEEVYIFTVRNGKLSSGIGVEDNLSRLRQLGIDPSSRSEEKNSGTAP
jgi:predicted ester cyclase